MKKILNFVKPKSRAKIARVVQAGMTLAGLPQEVFARFLQVHASVDIETAEKLAAEVAQVGINALTPEERSRLALKISKKAVRATRAVAGALQRAVDVAKATGVDPEALQRARAQLTELDTLDRVLGDAEQQVGDGKRVLEAWQFQAEGVVLGQLLDDLTNTDIPVEERRQLLYDAAEVLKVVEEGLAELRGARQQGKDQQQQLDGELEKVSNEISMFKTMRDVREKQQPVDQQQLEQMASYYAQYLEARKADKSRAKR